MNRKQHALIFVLGIVSGLLGGAVASSFLLGGFVFAQKVPEREKVIIAEEFKLVDKNGTTRASLSVTPDKAATLLLNDNRMMPSIILKGKGETGSSFLLLSGSKNSNIRVDFGDDDSPRVVLSDRDGKGRVLLFAAHDGAALIIRNKDEIVRGGLGLSNDGVMAVQLYDNGKVSAQLGTSEDGNTSLALTGKDGKKRVVLGSTVLKTSPTDIVESRPVSSLVLFDKDGNVIWKAP